MKHKISKDICLFLLEQLILWLEDSVAIELIIPIFLTKNISKIISSVQLLLIFIIFKTRQLCFVNQLIVILILTLLVIMLFQFLKQVKAQNIMLLLMVKEKLSHQQTTIPTNLLIKLFIFQSSLLIKFGTQPCLNKILKVI